MPRYPATDAVPTIRPRPSEIIVGTTASSACTVPIRLVCNWSANAALSHSSGRKRDHVPALSTATSRPPSAARTMPPAATVASRSVTSTGTTSIRLPDTSRSLSRLRALIATEAPRAASSRARAAPMPLDAPVTQIRLPSIRTSVLRERVPGQAELADAEVADAEAGLAVGEVELPHPAEGVVERAGELLPVAQELLPPQGEGPRVVRPEVAALDDRQGRVAGQVLRDRPDRRDDPAREHVLVDPGVTAAGGHQAVVGDRDRLQPDPAARCEQLVERREVGRPVGLPDGLDHLARHDRVVLPRRVAVVLEPDVDEVADAGVVGPLPRQGPLLGRQRQRGHPGAAFLGGTDGQPAP